MKGQRFPWLDLYSTGFTQGVRWFLYHAQSDSVPQHGQEWGYEVLTNGPTVAQNGFDNPVQCIVSLSYVIADNNVPMALKAYLEIMTEEIESLGGTLT